MTGSYIAFAILLCGAMWASVLALIAVMADRQVTRVIGNREEKDLDRRVDLIEERMNETLHSFEERLGEAIHCANAAAVAVGLDPSRERKKPTNRPG